MTSPVSRPVNRRNLLRAGTLGGLGIAIAGSIEAFAGPAAAQAPAAGYGALVPDAAGLLALPPGCRFAPRCPHRAPICDEGTIPFHETRPGHAARCTLYDPRREDVDARETQNA